MGFVNKPLLRVVLLPALLGALHALSVKSSFLEWTLLLTAAPFCWYLSDIRGTIRALVASCIFATVFHSMIFYSMLPGLKIYMPSSSGVNEGVFLLMCLASGAPWIIAAGVLKFLQTRKLPATWQMLGFASVFILTEWLLPTPTGTAVWAGTLVKYDLLKPIVPIFGVHGISAVYILSNIFLYQVLINLYFLRALLWGSLLIILILFKQPPPNKVQGAYRIGIVSLNTDLAFRNLGFSDKRQGEVRVRILDQYIKRTKLLLQENSPKQAPIDLVIWPEASYSSIFDKDVSAYIHNELAGQVSWLAIGAYSELSRRANANSLFFLPLKSEKNGKEYVKDRAAPFGEAGISLGAIFGRSKLSLDAIEPVKYTDIISLPFSNNRLLRIRPLICYESLFPQKEKDEINAYDLIVIISNEEGFPDTVGLKLFYAAAQLRALETGKLAIRVSNIGISAVVLPNGNAVFLSSGDRGETVTAVNIAITARR